MLTSFRAGLGAIAVAALSAVSAGAQVSPGGGDDVYIGIIEDDVKPIVIYVFSDPSTPDYQPIGRVAFYFEATYEQQPGEPFDAREACRFAQEFPEELPEKFQRRPIYGPNSAARFGDNDDELFLTAIDLPTYMARSATAVLFREGFLVTEDDAVPWFNCAGFFWVQLLEQPPEVWQQLYGEQLNR